jgi:hypothetical protein
MNYMPTTFVISFLLSTSLYPAATPPRSYDGANAAASAAAADVKRASAVMNSLPNVLLNTAHVKRAAAETDAKELDEKGAAEIFPASDAQVSELADIAYRFEIAKKLHEAGVIDRVDEQGYTPLQRAVQRGDRGMMRALIAYGADITVTYQGKSLEQLADSQVTVDLSHIITHEQTQVDRNVVQCIEDQWYTGRPLKPWLRLLIEQDDVQTFRKFFRSDRPNIQALLPLLGHGIRYKSLRIVRYILEQLELLSLNERTKSYILNKVIGLLHLEPFPDQTIRFSWKRGLRHAVDLLNYDYPPEILKWATGLQVLQEFMRVGYDPFCCAMRMDPKGSELLGDWICRRPFDFNAYFPRPWEAGELFVEENADHPAIDKLAARHLDVRERIAQTKSRAVQRRLEHRILPQKKLIAEVLMATDHPQKNAFNDLAPLIQAYAGLPRLSPLLSDEQGWRERLKRFCYKQLRKIQERIGHI